MAFVKLQPPVGRKALPVSSVVDLLRDEFKIVEIDRDEGESHVAGMIAATLRFSDEVEGKQSQVDRLQVAREHAVYVYFGDEPSVYAACVVMPQSELLFGDPDVVHGVARPLLDRAATALGYELLEG